MNIKRIMLAFGLTLGLIVNGAFAGESIPIEEIVVEASPLHKKKSELAQFATVLEGEKLRQQVARSLGETLNGELGVFSSSFGPSVGRPIIRGQGGERVRVLQDGVGSLDVSTISPDHSVGLEPMLAERIEVIRGPNTLVYGSGAIGGVVNVVDGRIPEQVPEKLTGAFEQRHSSVSDEDVSVIKLEGGSGSLAFHLDAVYRESNNTDIDGFAVRETDHEEEEHDDEEEAESADGYIENTSSRAKSGSFGFSWINEGSFLGFAVNRLENNYGIPPGAHAHHEEDGDDHDEDEHEDEEVNVRVDMEQTRYELKGRLMDPFAGIDKAAVKLAYNDYQHVELEGSEVGTAFDNEAMEGRIELNHSEWRSIHGVFGVQWQDREFSAVGDEAFVPPSETLSYGLFLVQDYHLDAWSFEWGARYEYQESEAEGFTSTSHDLFSLSVSAIFHVTDSTDISLVASRAQRAPAIEELFSDGFHAATNTYEIGDPNLKQESANNLEVSLRYNSGPVLTNISAFYNQIDGYIFERATGEFFHEDEGEIEPTCDGEHTEHCIDVYRFTQEDASFHGVEAELIWDALELAQAPVQVRVFTDYVRAELDQSGDVPRMPPWRYGLELSRYSPRWDAYIRAIKAEDQDNPGVNEEETEGYKDVSLGVNYHFGFARVNHTLFLRASNLLDDEIRNATSFLRDIAPQPGRSITIGYRGQF